MGSTFQFLKLLISGTIQKRTTLELHAQKHTLTRLHYSPVYWLSPTRQNLRIRMSTRHEIEFIYKTIENFENLKTSPERRSWAATRQLAGTRWTRPLPSCRLASRNKRDRQSRISRGETNKFNARENGIQIGGDAWGRIVDGGARGGSSGSCRRGAVGDGGARGVARPGCGRRIRRDDAWRHSQFVTIFICTSNGILALQFIRRQQLLQRRLKLFGLISSSTFGVDLAVRNKIMQVHHFIPHHSTSHHELTSTTHTDFN